MNSDIHAQPFEAPSLEEMSHLFENYQVLNLIACGGMGAVYHAIQTSLERHVAIKILPRVYSQDEHFRYGFETEAKAMAKLNHQNLITVYDFGEADGMLFMVMEYVAGKSLFHITDGQRVDEPYSIELIMDLCRGLAHAHEAGIIHRDMKPANVLLDEKMIPKIGDFGLARPNYQKVEDGEVIYGTPGYTAPEVTRPPFAFDQRADIYSLGVMLHQFLTRFLPSEDSRSASQICHCNPKIDLIIRRATYPDPNYRYSTIQQMLADLESLSEAPSNHRITKLVTVRATPNHRNGVKLQVESYRPPVPMEKNSSINGPILVVLFGVIVLVILSYFML